jgi:microcystin-dependent protein
MPASITKAGERLIAEKQAAHEKLKVVRFIIAMVPDLDPEQPVDRDAPKPPPEQIVHTQAYTQKGFVNPNQVVYSLMMGSDIGDFDWNWIGLETAEDVLLSVAYVPTQQKRKNTPPQQIGNNVTRNFLVAFDGAQALIEVTIDARTWQHDFTVRLRDIDERERLANRDVFGRACFFGHGLRLVKTGGGYQVKAGLAFLEGLRVELAKDLAVVPQRLPTQAWLDVALERQLNSAAVGWVIKWGADLRDYIDSAGVQHYLIHLADLSESGTVTDRRTVEQIDRPLVQHFAAHNGDYAQLRARGTTKADVELDQIPNAISDDPWDDSSEILATTAALVVLEESINDSFVGMVAAFDMPNAPEGWLKRNGANVSRTTYAKLFAVIGTRYGAGDGVTTFNVGDSRGVFIRALDDGRGLDPARTLGSLQQGQNLYHTHAASTAGAGNHGHSAWTGSAGHHNHTGSTTTNGSHQHILGIGPNVAFSGAAGVGHGRVNTLATDPAGDHAHFLHINGAGDHSHAVGIGPVGDHAHGVTVAASGGSEARPVNQALLVCIKY